MTLAAEVFRSSATVVPTFEIIFFFQEGGGDRSAAADVFKSSATVVPTLEIIFLFQEGGSDRSAAADVFRIWFAVCLHLDLITRLSCFVIYTSFFSSVKCT